MWRIEVLVETFSLFTGQCIDMFTVQVAETKDAVQEMGGDWVEGLRKAGYSIVSVKMRITNIGNGKTI